MSKHFPQVTAITLSLLLVVVPALPASGATTQPAQAGDVKAYKASGFINRTGAPQLEAVLATPVLWEDRVDTEAAGRVRIGLVDGSILNVGSNSQLTVTKHDAQTRQTELNLTLGKMRCVVKDLAPKEGQSFMIKTPTAVLGVIGTDFLVIVTATETRVFVFEGVVKTSNINAAILGTQNIHKGQQGLVRTGRPPSAPETAYRTDVIDSIRETEIGEKLPDPELKEREVAEKRGVNKWVIVGIAAGVAAAAIAIPLAASGGKTEPPAPPGAPSGGGPID